ALIPLIKNESKKFTNLKLDVAASPKNPVVIGDQTALGIIFKNLLENTSRHNPKPDKVVSVQITEEPSNFIVRYDDHGERFEGDIKSLGALFFKHESPKGSGIGLYLAKKLAKQQGGNLNIKNAGRLVFELRFKKGEQLE
ncbi:MAG: ATP-binding protein, partial [Bacteriovoracaceae bacterium]